MPNAILFNGAASYIAQEAGILDLLLGKPEIQGFNPLSSSEEKEQYDATIAWGQSNPDKIAIDINTLTL